MKLIPLAIICIISFISLSVIYGASTIDIAIVTIIVSSFFIIRFVAFGNISVSEWHEKQSHPTTKIQKLIRTIYPFDVIILYGIVMFILAR